MAPYMVRAATNSPAAKVAAGSRSAYEATPGARKSHENSLVGGIDAGPTLTTTDMTSGSTM